MNRDLRIGSRATIAFVMSAVAFMTAGCGAEPPAESSGSSADAISITSSFTSHGTGYYPDSSALEGGFVDRAGKPLQTLQKFLAGGAAYVSVAMDSSAFKYGARLRIKELDAKYGRAIIFRVVDTGGAFRGKGRTRIDICTASRKASLDPTINGTLHIDVINEAGGGSLDPEPTGTGGSALPAPAPRDDGNASDGDGAACSSDGQCNPGNNGSGLICTSGRCTSGCHRSSQCPGSQSCNSSGQCE